MNATPTYVTSYHPQPAPGSTMQYVVRWPRCIRGLSWAKIILASSIIILWVLGIIVAASSQSGRYYTAVGVDGTGIWMGIFMVTTAVMGVLAVKRSNKCFLIAYLVMAIIGALFAMAVFSMGVTWAAIAGQDHWSYDSSEGWHLETTASPGMKAASAFEAFLAVFAFIYAILAIIGSSFACCSVCGCCGGNTQQGAVLMQAPTAPPAPATATTHVPQFSTAQPMGYPPFNPTYSTPAPQSVVGQAPHPQVPYSDPNAYAPPPPYVAEEKTGFQP